MTAEAGAAGLPGRRRALLLACSDFADPGLPALRSPAADTRALTKVLSDPAGSAYLVTSRLNITSYEAQVAVEEFLADAAPDDLHLVYFSGHGILDGRGELYFAFTNTRRDLPGSTALAAGWLRAWIDASRSRRIVVLLDCCFSGAYLAGMRSRAGGDANVASLVRDLPEGSGVSVLTASGETEFSLEEDTDGPVLSARPSYFTEAIVTGIGTGAADRDRDGRITVDELYAYVYQRVRSGPSPQRPKKFGVGEGDVVVALTARSMAEPPRPPAPPEFAPHPTVTASAAPGRPVAVRGLLGTVTLDHDSIIVTKNGFGPGMKGSLRIPLSELVAITVKPATALAHGFIQFVVRDQLPQPPVRGGLAAGRPPRTDPYSMSFARKANNAIDELRRRVEEALDPDRHNRVAATTPPARSAGEAEQTTDTPAARDVDDQKAQAGAAPVAASATQARAQTDTRLTDRRRGHVDGANAGRDIPLSAVESLLIAQFDIQRWLEPWRERWRLILTGRAPIDLTLTGWLLPLARRLGSYVAPAETIQSHNTPTSDYVAGFGDGLTQVWNDAVRDRLLPPNLAQLSAWLREPAHPTPAAGRPRWLLTIRDLRRQVQKMKRARRMSIAAQIALPLSIVFFAVMEIGAIGVTVTGGWTTAPVASAIVANLLFGGPFVALATATLLRQRRKRRTAQSRHRINS